MKILFSGALRRAAAGALCLSLLFTALAPAAPVWAAGDGTLAVSEAALAESETAESGTAPVQAAAPADGEAPEGPAAPVQADGEAAEDSTAPVQAAAPADGEAPEGPAAPEALAAGGDLLLVAGSSATSLEGAQLRDGETLEGADSALHLTLCRGDANHPLLFDEAEFTLVKPGTDEPVPADAFYRYAGGDWGTYAQFFFSTASTDAGYGPLQDYFAALAPDFGVDVLATVKATGETLRAHIAYDWELSLSYTPESPAMIERTGEDAFSASVSVSLSDYANGLTARLDWLGKDFSLEGDLADLFTLTSADKGVLNFSVNPGKDPSQGEAVDGTLTFTRKADGLEDSIPLRYTPTSFSRELCWAVVENGKISDPEQLDLRVGQSGSVELRLYDTLNPTAADTPLAISEELFQSILQTSTLSDGLKLERGADGASLRLVYDLTAADARQELYSLQAQVDGVSAYLGIKVDNPAWVLAQGSLLPWPSGPYLQRAGFTRTDFNAYQPLSLNSLLEEYAVVPLKDGKPAASRAELEASGLTLEGAASDRIEAMAIPYREDAASPWQTAWAWVIRPVQQQGEERALSLKSGDEELASIPVKVTGFERLPSTPTGDGPTILGGQAVLQRTVSDTAQRGAVYSVGNQSGPLVLTAAPQVSGPAAGNVQITWEAGLSAFRLDYTGRQVPGDATITVQTAEGNTSMVIRFAAFGSSATYYSNGVDSMRRPFPVLFPPAAPRRTALSCICSARSTSARKTGWTPALCAIPALPPSWSKASPLPAPTRTF